MFVSRTTSRYLNNFNNDTKNARVDLEKLGRNPDALAPIRGSPIMHYLTVNRMTTKLDEVITKFTDGLEKSTGNSVIALLHGWNWLATCTLLTKLIIEQS